MFEIENGIVYLIEQVNGQITRRAYAYEFYSELSLDKENTLEVYKFNTETGQYDFHELQNITKKV